MDITECVEELGLTEAEAAVAEQEDRMMLIGDAVMARTKALIAEADTGLKWDVATLKDHVAQLKGELARLHELMSNPSAVAAQQGLDWVAGVGKSLEARHTALTEERVGRTERELAKALEGITDRVDRMEKNFEAMTRAAVDRAVVLLKALPAPVVKLPEGAIRIEQLPAVVNLPEGAVKVLVEQPPVNVNVPEQKSVVNFTTPRRKVEKHLTYDDQGRPVKIVEVEVDA